MAAYRTELFYDDAWNDITPDVRDSSPITIERGRRDWASDTDPAWCSLRLNNGPSKASAGVQGRYSPRNPRSDLYGKIGRNTPLRVREDAPRDSVLELPGVDGSYAWTPDAAALDITGDIDIRIDLEPYSWRPTVALDLISKWDQSTGDERAWHILVRTDGTVRLRWSPDGTFVNSIATTSSVAVPEDAGRVTLRFTLDVNNGASGNDTTFYTADSVDDTGTMLGTVQTVAGTTSIFSSAADVAIGSQDGGVPAFSDTDVFQGRVYAAQIRNGIGGTIIRDVDFTGQEATERVVADDVGNVWNLEQHALIHDTTIRFTGEVQRWPPVWDLSGADRWVNIKAFGISRRLQKGSKPLKSSLFRDLSIKDDVVAYWPLEEPSGATEFRAGRTGDESALRPTNLAEVAFAADDTFFASEPLPTVGAAQIRGSVPDYDGADDQRLVFLVSIPGNVTWGSDKVLARFFTTGSVRRWDLIKTSADNTFLRAWDRDGVQVLNHFFAFPLFGAPHALSLWLQQDGSDIDVQAARFPLDGSTAFASSATISSETFGRFSTVVFGTTDDMENTAFGHPFILNDDVQSVWDTILNSMQGWSGETAPERFYRLGTDEGLIVRGVGNALTAEEVGFQRPETLMSLFREAATADLGILTDRRDAVGLQYRTRQDLYSQTPKLVLDYASGVIADPFQPVEDDKSVANEITVSRPRGSSFTAQDTTGPLSSLDPPDGVGLYDVSQEVNISSDDRLEDQAYWRLHLGTVDELRFPEVTLNLRNSRAEALLDQVLSLNEGDIIRITNPPIWLPGGPYDLLVEAVREERTAATHEITFTCSPGSAWNAFMLDDSEVGRLDAGGSTLDGALTATATTFDVATATGSQVWARQDIALLLQGVAGDYASTPDAAALDITGDIDIRVEVWREDWTTIGSLDESMASKYLQTGDERSWRFDIQTGTNVLLFAWSTDGTAATLTTQFSTVIPPRPVTGRVAYRVTLDVSTGDVTFYWSESIDGTWEQVGDVVPGSATSINASAADLIVGGRGDGSQTPWNGAITAAEVYSGIAGTLVADPDFTVQAIGARSFTDSQGLVWTLQADARLDPADPFEITVGGEVMTVHAIDGTTSPQTFTVRRAVNGVVKAHDAGDTVVLAKPFVLSL